MERASRSQHSASLPSTNQTYRLKFFDDAHGVAKDIEFEAKDASRALIIAHREARNRSAELWCDGRKTCTIRRLKADAWEISPAL
jgi:hypothetical protein